MAYQLPRFFGICFFLASLFFLISTNLNAQATNGAISGVVLDTTGAVLPGVSVQVKNVSTGVVCNVVSNEVGRYRVPDL